MSDALPKQAVHLSPGEGPTYWVVGDMVTIKATSAQTNGAFTQIETTVAPNAGPPPHIHTREDEWFTMLEGEIRFEIDGAVIVGTPGTTLCGPRNVPHSFRNVSDRPARMLVTITPGGIESFFEAAGVPIVGGAGIPSELNEAHIERLMAAAGAQGIKILPPPQAA